MPSLDIKDKYLRILQYRYKTVEYNRPAYKTDELVWKYCIENTCNTFYYSILPISISIRYRGASDTTIPYQSCTILSYRPSVCPSSLASLFMLIRLITLKDDFDQSFSLVKNNRSSLMWFQNKIQIINLIFHGYKFIASDS